ncbi:hypothetical protein CB1_000444031 [Camelus ferus]|nr:hypothetical protein CB1_000444031 [Camelus ferus]
MESGCWLLGGEFEDSVFEERRERRLEPPVSYCAKRCEPQVRARGFSASPQPRGLALLARQRFRRPTLAYSPPTPDSPGTSRALLHPPEPPCHPFPARGTERRLPSPTRLGLALSAPRGTWRSVDLLVSRSSSEICSNSRGPTLILQPGSQGPQKSSPRPLFKP